MGIYMQEVLSRPGEAEKPVKEQEYWILELLEFTESWRPHFVVQQHLGSWSDIDGCSMFSGDPGDWEEIETLGKAKERYEARRANLVASGFIQSDMEF